VPGAEPIRRNSEVVQDGIIRTICIDGENSTAAGSATLEGQAIESAIATLQEGRIRVPAIAGECAETVKLRVTGAIQIQLINGANTCRTNLARLRHTKENQNQLAAGRMV
jgi:hypothetical protein